MTIKAIETVYNGYKFRSRLEARWAVFFDTLGIEYEYEAQGYELQLAGDYLPDFWLPKQGCWLEVKGVRPERGPELDKAYAKPRALAYESGIQVYVAAGSIKPGLTEFAWGNGRYGTALDVNMLDCMLLPESWSEEDRIRFNPSGPWQECWVQCDECFDCYIGMWCSPNEDYVFACPSCSATKGCNHPATKDLLDAYITARQARFEHGETP